MEIYDNHKELHPSVLHNCIFLRKLVEEESLDMKTVKSEENGLGWYVKNSIEPLLVAVRTSRT